MKGGIARVAMRRPPVRIRITSPVRLLGSSCARMRRGFSFSLPLVVFALTPACGARTSLDTSRAVPGIDGSVTNIYQGDCVNASATLVYVVTQENQVFSFDPTSTAFTLLGPLSCPAASGATPFSMAVDRKGIAYVVFTDGELFRVDLASVACSPTSFVPDQQGFLSFGMGFTTVGGGPGETLYVAAAPQNATSTISTLATIDTTTFALSVVAPMPNFVFQPELTGSGDGRLFAFSADSFEGSGSFIAQIDTTTAAVVASTALPSVTQGNGWAFGFWGGDFWMFTATSQDATSSDVTRYRPSDGTVEVVATLPSLIVGAGVSTCAPQ
jgi:hypothetical protein